MSHAEEESGGREKGRAQTRERIRRGERGKKEKNDKKLRKDAFCLVIMQGVLYDVP